MADAELNPNPYCPVHKIIQRDVEEVKKKQGENPCEVHSMEISTLKESDSDQWDAITELRKTVWGWKGAAALASFMGSLLGAGIVTMVLHRFLK